MAFLDLNDDEEVEIVLGEDDDEELRSGAGNQRNQEAGDKGDEEDDQEEQVVSPTNEMFEALKRENTLLKESNTEVTERLNNLENYALQSHENQVNAARDHWRQVRRQAREDGDTAAEENAEEQIRQIDKELGNIETEKSRRKSSSQTKETKHNKTQQQQQQEQQRNHAYESWLAKNSWWGQPKTRADLEKQGKARVIGFDLVNKEGLDPTSPKYYKRLDELMGQDSSAETRNRALPPRKQARHTTRQPDNAPAIRQGNKLVFTREHVAMANGLGINLQDPKQAKDFARNIEQSMEDRG